MNAVERIQATFSGNPTDRRAVSLTLSLYGARLANCPLPKYYTDPHEYAKGQEAVLHRFQPDVLFSPFVLSAEGEAFGSRVAYFDKQPPQISEPAIGDADAISTLKTPDPSTHPRLLYIRNALRLIVEKCINVPVASPVVSPVALPALIFGFDEWLRIFMFDDESRQRVFERTIPFSIAWANSLLADGAGCIVMPALFTLPHILTRYLAEKFVVPLLKESLAQINGPILIHHTGARILPFLDLFAGMPNVAGFVIDANENLSKAREIIGPDRILLSGIDGPSLTKQTPERIHAICRKVLKNREGDPRFILATTAADIDFDAQPENILAIKESSELFSRGK